jgi:hypothetical protein
VTEGVLHPNCGVEAGAGRMEYSPMDAAPTPRQPSPNSSDDTARVKAWIELRHELEQLHARLEYLRLMLKLGVRQ